MIEQFKQVYAEKYMEELADEVEQMKFRGGGTLRITLQPGTKTLRGLEVEDIYLDVSYITCHLGVVKEIKAWGDDDAHMTMRGYMSDERQNIQNKLNENGVDASVEVVTDETYVELK